ncbi:MAG TPA: N-acetyltransferase [Flavobacteriales bacterium]|nr:N-acetyltransferase [Flavobacteriales bacterium]HIA12626.1 N-acetyltransferase [Flavobacteriales bacterium]
MILTGKTLKLRALELSDVDLLYKWENNTSIWNVSNTLVPFSRESIEQFVTYERDIYSDKQLRLVICLLENEKAIGCVDLYDYDMRHQRAGVGILIADETERKKGLATEALEVLKEYAKETLILHQLYCNIPEDNKKSMSLFEKAGFVNIGVKKDWIKTKEGWLDEHLFQLIVSL